MGISATLMKSLSRGSHDWAALSLPLLPQLSGLTPFKAAGAGPPAFALLVSGTLVTNATAFVGSQDTLQLLLDFPVRHISRRSAEAREPVGSG